MSNLITAQEQVLLSLNVLDRFQQLTTSALERADFYSKYLNALENFVSHRASWLVIETQFRDGYKLIQIDFKFKQPGLFNSEHSTNLVRVVHNLKLYWSHTLFSISIDFFVTEMSSINAILSAFGFKSKRAACNFRPMILRWKAE